MEEKRGHIRLLILYNVFTALLCLLYPVSIFAQPCIIFSDIAYDFGQIYQNQQVEHIFKFKNTGDQVLNIEKIKTTCGCTAASVSKKSLKPGEEGQIKVIFDSARRKGKQKKTIYVHSNDPVEPVAYLCIESYVKAELEIFPEKVYFQNLEKGKTLTQEVVIKNTGANALSIKSLETNSSYISAGLKPEESKFPIVLEQNASLKISISARAPEGNNRITGRVIINTDSQTIPQVIIPVTLISPSPLKKRI